jgi:chorismate mutase/prephenate dehydratase
LEDRAKKKLKEFREKFDQIDDKILKLLNERAILAKNIGKLKLENNLQVYSIKREKEILDRLNEKNKGPLQRKAIQHIFSEIISASRALEKPLTIAYLGPEATFTHIAALQQFGSSAEYLQKKNINEIFMAMERNEADYGVVPIENSTQGIIYDTLDMFIDSNQKICFEILLRITHNLLSKAQDLREVKKLYSHPQPLAQCSLWIAKNLPNINIEEVSSSAMAAKIARDDSKSVAIASDYAAKLYELNILNKQIEDNLNNFTRFWVIGQNMPEKSGKDKTSIMFAIKDKVGALYHILEPFAHLNINLTKIESRPYRKRVWEYIFFLDIEGHISDSNISKAFEIFKKNTLFFKILGSYTQTKYL